MNVTNVTLKAQHFRTRGPNKCLMLTPDGVSNGYWLLRRTSIGNIAIFADKATATAALRLRDGDVSKSTTVFESLADKSPAREWIATQLQINGPNHGLARIFRDAEGTLMAITCSDLHVVDANRMGETLWGSSPIRPFRNAEKIEDAAFLVTPVMLPKGLTITINE